jgi:beta-lactamase class D
MSGMAPHLSSSIAAAASAALLTLAACDRAKAPSDGGGAPAGFDKARLEAEIDSHFGGVGTCVVLADTGTGRNVYRYGSHTVCMRQLPPCSTFKIPNSLIGLDAGIVTPATVFKWDGKPQPTSAWETDADMKTAFQNSIVWWYQRVARQVGKPAYAERLKAFDYGTEKPDGPVDGFWLGPENGQALLISTEQQAEFLRRLYTDRLPVKPSSAAFVKEIMVDTRYGGSTISGKTGTCPSNEEQSRQVGWWVGRIQSPPNDVVFAISIEGANNESLPAGELAIRAKSAFTAAGLWPRADAAAPPAGAPSPSA